MPGLPIRGAVQHQGGWYKSASPAFSATCQTLLRAALLRHSSTGRRWPRAASTERWCGEVRPSLGMVPGIQGTMPNPTPRTMPVIPPLGTPGGNPRIDRR
jgi:hypothetical protein